MNRKEREDFIIEMFHHIGGKRISWSKELIHKIVDKWEEELSDRYLDGWNDGYTSGFSDGGDPE